MEIIPFISFLTGVLSILSPCILPVLPIVVGFNLEKRTNKEILFFVLGLFSIFIIILFITAYFTVAVYRYLNYVRVISAIILLLIGGYLLTQGNCKFLSLTYHNTDNAFILGFLTSLSWAPCYGGYLISLLSLLITSGNPVFVGLNIVIYCIGFGLTLFVLSYLISKINLSKISKKVINIQKIFACLIIIGSFYMLITSLGGIL